MPTPHPFRPHVVTASDGTPLTLHVSEGGADHGSILLLGAPGTPPSFWAHQAEHLGRSRRLIVFQHPEVSSPTASGARTPEQMRGDVLSALAAPWIDRAAIVSWGLGAQLALSVAGAHPERLSGLVLINPLLSASFARAAGVDGGEQVAAAIGKLAAHATPWLVKTHQRFARILDASAWLKRARLASPTIEQEALDEVIADLDRTSSRGIALVLRALERQHDAPVLERIPTPTLVVEGEADIVGSSLIARRLARRMPHGELKRIRGGTHLTPLEFPEYISLLIERFLTPAPPPSPA